MTGRDLSGRPGETVGSCPNCEWPLTRFDVLIEYETTGEQTRTFAECRECEDAVYPQ